MDISSHFHRPVAQIKIFRDKAVTWLVHSKKILLVSTLSVVMAVAAVSAYWYRESLRTSLQHALRIPAALAPLAVATPDPTLQEQLAILHDRIDTLEKQYQADAQYRQQLATDFQSAIHEVATNNDQLITQGQQLSQAVQDVRAEVRGLTTSSSAESTAQPTASSPGTATSVSQKININTANAAGLDTLPGIGPSYAQAIIQYRTDHGPFKAIHDITNVPGIGDATFNKLQELITV